MRSGLGVRRRDRRKSRQWMARRRKRWPSFSSKSSPRPAFDEAAKAKFASKKNLRLVEINNAPQKWVLKNVSGGMLVQDADMRVLAGVRSQSSHQTPAYAEEKRALLFAWKVAST